MKEEIGEVPEPGEEYLAAVTEVFRPAGACLRHQGGRIVMNKRHARLFGAAAIPEAGRSRFGCRTGVRSPAPSIYHVRSVSSQPLSVAL